MGLSLAQKQSRMATAAMDVASGADLDEVAVRHAVHPTCVIGWCKKYGVPVRRRNGCGRKTRFVRDAPPQFGDLITVMELALDIELDASVTRIDLRRMHQLVTRLELALTAREGLRK